MDWREVQRENTNHTARNEDSLGIYNKKDKWDEYPAITAQHTTGEVLKEVVCQRIGFSILIIHASGSSEVVKMTEVGILRRLS